MALTLKDGYEIGVRVHHDPIVWVIDDFATPDECAHVIELAAGRIERAKVSTLGTNAVSERRTGSVCWVKHDETAIVAGVVGRVSELVGVPVDHAESLQVVHYGPTQEYQPHYDAWDIMSEKGQEKTRIGGNRAVTALLYLNEVEAGGGTGFPKIDVEVDPVPGRLCIFHDLIPGRSNRHRDALHGGLPVVAGEKWACNLWFRERPYRASTATAGGRPGTPSARVNRQQRRRNGPGRR
jgi:prolyl 4-hydroxylase